MVTLEKSQWMLRALDLGLAEARPEVSDVVARNQKIADAIKLMKQTLAKMTLPDDASKGQAGRLAVPVQEAHAALEQEQLKEAAAALKKAQQAFADMGLEIARKRSILDEQARQEPPVDASERQRARLQAVSDAIGDALGRDAFDEAQARLQALLDLHETVRDEIVRRKEIEQNLALQVDPAEADKDELAALDDLRKLTRAALDDDRFADAGKQVEAVADEIERLVMLISDEQGRAKALADAINDNSVSAVKDIAKTNKLTGEVAKKWFLASAAYVPLDKNKDLIGDARKSAATTGRARLKTLLAEGETWKAAALSAGDEVKQDLNDLRELLAGQSQTARRMREDNDKLLGKLEDPANFTGPLLASWPKDLPRSKDKLPPYETLDTLYDLQSTAAIAIEAARTAEPWIDADYVGRVFPACNNYRTALAKAAKEMSTSTQALVLQALKDAVTEQKRLTSESMAKIRETLELRVSKAKPKPEPPTLDKAQAEILQKLDSAKGNVNDKLKLLATQLADKLKVFDTTQEDSVKLASKSGVDTAEVTDPTVQGGKTFELIGGHGDSAVYARVDDCPWADTAFKGLYETAMRKGVIPSSSTGSEGVKYESHLGGWVIKLTRRAVAHNPGLDNTEGPLAPDAGVVQLKEPKAIYLDFTGWVARH